MRGKNWTKLAADWMSIPPWEIFLKRLSGATLKEGLQPHNYPTFSKPDPVHELILGSTRVEPWLGSWIDLMADVKRPTPRGRQTLKHMGSILWDQTRRGSLEEAHTVQLLRRAGLVALAPALLPFSRGRQWLAQLCPEAEDTLFFYDLRQKQRYRIAAFVPRLLYGLLLIPLFLGLTLVRGTYTLALSSYHGVDMTAEGGPRRWYHWLMMPLGFLFRIVVHVILGDVARLVVGLLGGLIGGGLWAVGHIYQNPTSRRVAGALIGTALITLMAYGMLPPGTPGYVYFLNGVGAVSSLGMSLPMTVTLLMVVSTLGLCALAQPLLAKPTSKTDPILQRAQKSWQVRLLRYAAPLMLGFMISNSLLPLLSESAYLGAMTQFNPMMLLVVLITVGSAVGCHFGANHMAQRSAKKQRSRLGQPRVGPARRQQRIPQPPPPSGGATAHRPAAAFAGRRHRTARVTTPPGHEAPPEVRPGLRHRGGPAAHAD